MTDSEPNLTLYHFVAHAPSGPVHLTGTTQRIHEITLAGYRITILNAAHNTTTQHTTTQPGEGDHDSR